MDFTGIVPSNYSDNSDLLAAIEKNLAEKYLFNNIERGIPLDVACRDAKERLDEMLAGLVGIAYQNLQVAAISKQRG